MRPIGVTRKVHFLYSESERLIIEPNQDGLDQDPEIHTLRNRPLSHPNFATLNRYPRHHIRQRRYSPTTFRITCITDKFRDIPSAYYGKKTNSEFHSDNHIFEILSDFFFRSVPLGIDPQALNQPALHPIEDPSNSIISITISFRSFRSHGTAVIDSL